MTFAATILTLYPEMFPGPLVTSLDTGGLYSRPDVYELSVDTRPKDGVNWQN